MATTRSIALDTLIPAQAIHPGELLADELAFAGLSQRELARQLDVPVSVLNEVINGKRRLTADLAVKLEAALDLTAEHWNNLQATYDLEVARIQQRDNAQLPAVAALRDLRDYVPMKELRKRDILIDDAVADVARLLALYRVSSPQDIIKVIEDRKKELSLFRRSERLKMDPVNLTAWVMLAQEAARNQAAATFDDNLDQQALLADIHHILIENKNVVAALQARLAAAGIKLVVVDNLPQTPIDGMAWWCEEGECPAIALTIRHKRLDNLIFTLFHELGHVFQHLGRGGQCEFLDVETDGEKLPKVEQEANAWATKNLVPAEVLERFLSSGQRMQEQYLLDIAREVNVSPVILLGQRCFTLRDFGPLKKATYNQIG
jgi:HTH-type transcriptional regulator/antitoxin HigA